jgi:hypothetical protein
LVPRLAFLLAGLDSADSAERAAFGARELLQGCSHQARAALQEILKGDQHRASLLCSLQHA